MGFVTQRCDPHGFAAEGILSKKKRALDSGRSSPLGAIIEGATSGGFKIWLFCTAMERIENKLGIVLHGHEVGCNRIDDQCTVKKYKRKKERVIKLTVLTTMISHDNDKPNKQSKH